MQFIVAYVSKSMLVAQTLNLLILPLTAQIVCHAVGLKKQWL